MRALVNSAPGVFELTELAAPEPPPGQVLIRTTACGICATDIEVSLGSGRTSFPAVLGHEWTGIVERSGPGGDPSLVGRRCVGENVLSDGGEIGFEHPGGYGEFFLTEERLVRTLPDRLPSPAAAMIEPLAVCVRALHRIGGAPIDTALVLGDGPIGLLMTALLAGAGSGDSVAGEITVAGGREARLAVAREWGACNTIPYRSIDCPLPQACRALAPDGFSLVIEATGRADVADAAVELAGRSATVAILGDYGVAQAGFAWNAVIHRELTVVGSNASAGGWDEAVRIARTGALDLTRLVTHVLPVERYREGLDLVRSRDPAVVKVVLDWEGSQ